MKGSSNQKDHLTPIVLIFDAILITFASLFALVFYGVNLYLFLAIAGVTLGLSLVITVLLRFSDES